MRIHHLNCVSMCPIGGRLMDGRSRGVGPSQLAVHCVLLELGERLVLLDTGFGLQDVRHPRERLSRFFLEVCRPNLREKDTAVRQIERMGFSADDVTDILLTHLDFDHAGGLDDFPRAKVHLMADEWKAARHPRGFIAKRRFRPQQWSSESTRWYGYHERGERWQGFSAVRELVGLPPEILFVPLYGHTAGHAGIAVQEDDHWLLYAGDAYFYRKEIAADRHCPPGLRLYQDMMDTDRRMRLENQERLRELRRRNGGEVLIFCAHDMTEYERLAWASWRPRPYTRASEEQHAPLQ